MDVALVVAGCLMVAFAAITAHNVYAHRRERKHRRLDDINKKGS